MITKEQASDIYMQTDKGKPKHMQFLSLFSDTLFVPNRARPLMLGINQMMLAKCADDLTDEIARALKWWTTRMFYYKVLTAHASRYDLEGNVCGEVAPEHAVDVERMNRINKETKEERSGRLEAKRKKRNAKNRARRKARKAGIPAKVIEVKTDGTKLTLSRTVKSTVGKTTVITKKKRVVNK